MTSGGLPARPRARRPSAAAAASPCSSHSAPREEPARPALHFGGGGARQGLSANYVLGSADHEEPAGHVGEKLKK